MNMASGVVGVGEGGGGVNTYHEFPTDLLPFSSASRRYCAALNCFKLDLPGLCFFSA